MKFVIDKNYLFAETMGIVVSYIVILLIVYSITSEEETINFAIPSLSALILLYYTFIIRLSINVENGRIIYKKENAMFKDEIDIKSITQLEKKKGLFWTSVEIVTKYGKRISLKPKDPDTFIRELNSKIE